MREAKVIGLLLLAIVSAAARPAGPAVQADPAATLLDPNAPVYLVSSRETYDRAIAPFARGVAERVDSLGTHLVIARLYEYQLADVSRYVHEEEGRCGGFFAFPTLAEAEAFIAGDRSAHALTHRFLGEYTIDNQETVDPWLPQVQEADIRATIEHLSTAQPNRYYTSPHGHDAAVWIHDTWLALAGGRDDVSAELFTDCGNCGGQPSVILTIEGAELPDEIVVLGGHLDSIRSGGGGHPEQDAPGADDDGSGIATLTEVLRVALAGDWEPKRTVKFMGYAAEEVGLRGSHAIAQAFAAEGENVVGVLQLDMTNYDAGATVAMRLMTDNSNADLQQFARDLFDEYLAPLGLTRGTYTCGYACSDHASWTAAGYPAAMMFEPTFNTRLHTPNDTLPQMGGTAHVSVPFAQFGLAFLGELAKTAAEETLPALTFTPASLDFGDVEIGTTSAPQIATLHNDGNALATGLAFAGLPDAGFAADTGDCGTSLAPGASCEVSVTFTPAEVGAATATLEAGSAEGAAASLAVEGEGVPAAVVATPRGLAVDPDPGTSDGNGILEPAELVTVAPAWRNDGAGATELTGGAAEFGGPAGANYSLTDAAAGYGLLAPGATASCLDTGDCYQMGLNDPATRPAAHWDATFEETLAGGPTRTWTLHVGASFTDVPRTSPFYPSIETLLHAQVTGGCGAGAYCPGDPNTRSQMPVFLLKALEGGAYTPPACTGVFADVPCPSLFANWIEDLMARGVTAGCGGGNYCPSASVTRDQMAVFLLKTLEGPGYTPPACTGVFGDVPCPSLFAAWIEDLVSRGITAGCGGGNYCPSNPVSRDQMAVFLAKTFGLTLYGP